MPIGAFKAGLLGAAGADSGPTFDQVVLLIQPTSSDSSVIDLSDNGYSITATSASLVTSPTSRGEKAVDLTSPGRLELTADSNFDLGRGDFCAEGIARSPRDGVDTLFSMNSDRLIGWLDHPSYNSLAFYDDATGGGVGSSGTAPTANSYQHHAWYRKDGTLYFAVDGEVVGSVSYDFDVGNSSGTFYLGYQGAGQNPLSGYIDCFRLIKGHSVYGAEDFTPPSSFPTS